MQKILLSFLLLTVLLICFSQHQPPGNMPDLKKAWTAADKIYRQAEKLAAQAGDNETLQAKADETYQQALTAFQTLIPAAEKSADDSLNFFLHLRTGFINYYFDSAEAARKDYSTAIALKQKLPEVADSFLFLPYLYTGGIYYTNNQFDSALFFYKKAETINDSYINPLNESQRLFNRLGVMYYETGNYGQAKNYFEKAITLTTTDNKNLLVNYKINIASILIKLEDYGSARSVYESILPFNEIGRAHV